MVVLPDIAIPTGANVKSASQNEACDMRAYAVRRCARARASMPATASAVQAAMSVEVPTGQYRLLRLRSLIKDVVLEVVVQVPTMG